MAWWDDALRNTVNFGQGAVQQVHNTVQQTQKEAQEHIINPIVQQVQQAPGVVDNTVKITQGVISAAQKAVAPTVQQIPQQTRIATTNYLAGFNRPVVTEPKPAVVVQPQSFDMSKIQIRSIGQPISPAQAPLPDKEINKMNVDLNAYTPQQSFPQKISTIVKQTEEFRKDNPLFGVSPAVGSIAAMITPDKTDPNKTKWDVWQENVARETTQKLIPDDAWVKANTADIPTSKWTKGAVPDIPVADFTRGVVGYVRDKPLDVGIDIGAMALMELSSGGAGTGALPAVAAEGGARKVAVTGAKALIGKAIPYIEPGMMTLYGGSAITDIASKKTPEEQRIAAGLWSARGVTAFGADAFKSGLSRNVINTAKADIKIIPKNIDAAKQPHAGNIGSGLFSNPRVTEGVGSRYVQGIKGNTVTWDKLREAKNAGINIELPSGAKINPEEILATLAEQHTGNQILPGQETAIIWDKNNKVVRVIVGQPGEGAIDIPARLVPEGGSAIHFHPKENYIDTQVSAVSSHPDLFGTMLDGTPLKMGARLDIGNLNPAQQKIIKTSPSTKFGVIETIIPTKKYTEPQVRSIAKILEETHVGYSGGFPDRTDPQTVLKMTRSTLNKGTDKLDALLIKQNFGNVKDVDAFMNSDTWTTFRNQPKIKKIYNDMYENTLREAQTKIAKLGGVEIQRVEFFTTPEGIHVTKNRRMGAVKKEAVKLPEEKMLTTLGLFGSKNKSKHKAREFPKYPTYSYSGFGLSAIRARKSTKPKKHASISGAGITISGFMGAYEHAKPTTKKPSKKEDLGYAYIDIYSGTVIGKRQKKAEKPKIKSAVSEKSWLDIAFKK